MPSPRYVDLCRSSVVEGDIKGPRGYLCDPFRVVHLPLVLYHTLEYLQLIAFLKNAKYVKLLIMWSDLKTPSSRLHRRVVGRDDHYRADQPKQLTISII